MSVTIAVPPLDGDVELIAHEIEHVIEQLHAVHLRRARQAARQRIGGKDLLDLLHMSRGLGPTGAD